MNMSLEQAIGQKLLYSFEGREPSPEIAATIAQQHVGGVTLFRSLNVAGPAQVYALTATLQRAAQEAGQPPLLIAVDQEGGQLVAIDGGTTLFPGNLAIGATRSTDLAYRSGYAIGRELSAMGVNVNYAPVCDVNINPRNPAVGTRSFGDDPQLVARLATAMTRGLQEAGVAATAKHFPGLGDTALDSHFGTPVIPHGRDRLELVELAPFRAVVAGGARLVMAGHGAFPALDGDGSIPATLSAPLLRGVLRRELGFGGVIVSDSLDMAAIGRGQDLTIDAIAAAAAGIDLLLLAGACEPQPLVYAGLLRAAQRALLDRDDVIASAGRVLALKRWVGAQPRPPLDVVGCAEHRDLAAEIARKALTLVRDGAGLIPLALSASSRVGVITPRPMDLTPADTSSYVVCTLADELRRHHPQVDDIVVAHSPTDDEIAALRQRALDYDALVVGTINAATQPAQAAMVNSLLEVGVPTIVVALRTPYDLHAYPQAPTYCCAYGILPCAMSALADALLGRVPFLGTLPVAIAGR